MGITFREDDPDNPLKKAFKKVRITKSPIVNGITAQNMANGNTFFDYDGNGFAERTGWTSAGDGILVRDLNGNGFIALADLDSNGDGKFDQQDATYCVIKS